MRLLHLINKFEFIRENVYLKNKLKYILKHYMMNSGIGALYLKRR